MPRIGCPRLRVVPVFPLALLVVALGCREDDSSPTAPAPQPALAITATTALAFYQMSGGYHFTCGLTTDNRAYCWGYNVTGSVGDGTTIERHAPVPVVGGLRFRQVSAGAISACGVTTDFRAYCWGRTTTACSATGQPPIVRLPFRSRAGTGSARSRPTSSIPAG
jgi:hypothetical protein